MQDVLLSPFWALYLSFLAAEPIFIKHPLTLAFSNRINKTVPWGFNAENSKEQCVCAIIMADCGVKSQPIRWVKTVSSNVETGEPLSQSSLYQYYNVYYLKGILNAFFVVLSKMEFRLGAAIHLLVLVCPLVFHMRWYINLSIQCTVCPLQKTR